MMNEPYMTKEEKHEKKPKPISVAVHPSGNQYHIKSGDLDHFLHMRGFTCVASAKKAGWRFS